MMLRRAVAALAGTQCARPSRFDVTGQGDHKLLLLPDHPDEAVEDGDGHVQVPPHAHVRALPLPNLILLWHDLLRRLVQKQRLPLCDVQWSTYD